MKLLKKPEVRKYLYGVGVAGMALLAMYGVVSPDQLNAWLVFGAAVLGVGGFGMAAVNTGE